MKNKKTQQAVMAIDYKEGDPSTYKGVTVWLGEPPKTWDMENPLVDHRAFTGHPKADYLSALAWAEDRAESVSLSSSFEGFAYDGGEDVADKLH